MQPRTYRTEGVIIHRFNTAEADRIVTVFSKHHGKLRCMAKGIRKPTSKKSGHLELFCRSTLFIAKGKNLDYITQTEVIERYDSLRDNLKITKAAYHLVELIDTLTGEQQESEPVYNLLVSTLRAINSQQYATQKQIMDFEISLLNELGFGLPINVSKESLEGHIESIMEKKLRSIEVFKQV